LLFDGRACDALKVYSLMLTPPSHGALIIG
jgi:hypothetical protein